MAWTVSIAFTRGVKSVAPERFEGGGGIRDWEPLGAFQYQKISLPKISLQKMSFVLVQSGWGESECFNKNLAPGSSEVFKDIFRAYRNAPCKYIGFGTHPRIWIRETGFRKVWGGGDTARPSQDAPPPGFKSRVKRSLWQNLFQCRI